MNQHQASNVILGGVQRVLGDLENDRERFVVLMTVATELGASALAHLGRDDRRQALKDLMREVNSKAATKRQQANALPHQEN